jgi:hypothetical protein
MPHTLHYWHVGFKNESDVIWVTVLNLFLTTVFSKKYGRSTKKGVESFLNKSTEVFMLSVVSFLEGMW